MERDSKTRKKGRLKGFSAKDARVRKKTKPPPAIPPETGRAKRPMTNETPDGTRLQKAIADAGITSRRKAEEMILEGRVRVNGKTVTELGTRVDPFIDSIFVDGRRLNAKEGRVYVLLYKPRGVISSVSDPQKRPVVIDLIKKRIKARVYPVGRLDYDAEGALLLTNDGEFSNGLIHPGAGVPKKYLIKVKDAPTAEAMARLEKGVSLEDGRTMPCHARFIRKTAENSWIELTVFEGRNRLVKRMCMAIGHPVQKLKRVEFAGVGLGSMKPGDYRLLTPDEVKRLKALGHDTPRR